MRIAIVGAGAIGSYLGAQLAAAGNEVSLIARGEHLQALKEKGVKVRFADRELAEHPFATDDPAEVGAVDAVFLTLKANSLPAMAPRLAPLLGPATTVISGQNGIPWWFFQNFGGPMEGTRLEKVDPGGLLLAAIPIHRIVGCVIYPSATIVEPGVILHIEGNRFAIGEPDGQLSERCEKLAAVLQNAGLRCPVRRRIRHEIWVKLIGNLALNPVSVLTGATLEEMLKDEGARELIRSIMEEGVAVAKAIGLHLDISVEQRMQGAERVGAHKTSMLQDFERGRPLELDCIAGAVVELAGEVGVSVPCTGAVYACAKLLERECESGRLPRSPVFG